MATVGHQPDDHQPDDHQPNGYRPDGHQPNSYQPVFYQPVFYQPTSYQPDGYLPDGSQPAVYQPVFYQTAGYQPDGSQPAVYQPSGYQPVVYQPAGYQPVVYEPVGHQRPNTDDTMQTTKDTTAERQGLMTEDPGATAAKTTTTTTPKHEHRFWLAFISVAIIALTAVLDSTTLSLALTAITEDIGGGDIEAFWAGTSYLLSSTSFLLLWCSLSDVFGRRATLFVCIAFLVAGSIVCARARNYSVLIAGRTVQGVGGGGIMGLTYVIITDLVPLRQRPQFVAMLNAITSLGSILGPIIGGACAVRGQWPWIFWLNLPICFISYVGLSHFLNLQQRREKVAEKLRKLDWVGSGIFIASITSFLIPVTWGGLQFPWSSWHTLVPLCLGAAGLVGVGLHQRFIAAQPFLPRQIFATRSVPILFLGSFTNGLILYSILFYMPEYFEGVKGYSNLVAGVATLPATLTVIPCAIGTGIGMSKTGRYRGALWVGWALCALGLGVLCVLDVNTSIAGWVFINVLSGIGTGILLPSINLGVQASVPQTHVAMSTMLVFFFRNFGQAVGVAIGSSILGNVLHTQLDHAGVPEALLSLSSTELVEVLRTKSSSLSPELVHTVRSALITGFRAVWGTLIGLAVVNGVLQIFVQEFSLNQAHVTEQGWAADRPETHEEEQQQPKTALPAGRSQDTMELNLI